MYITNWHWRMGQSMSHCLWRGGTPGLCEPGLRWWFRVVLSQQLWAQRRIQPPYCFNWASKPGNDMSLQPALVSYTLCLHTKTFSSFSSTGTWGEVHGKTLLKVEAAGVLWQFPVELLIFRWVSALKFVTNRAAMMDTRSWSREFHHKEEIEYCRLHFLYLGQSQETAHANTERRLFHILCLSESCPEHLDNRALILYSYLKE